ncbi:MFS transporter [Alicyclobacillus cycloheptanicus]|uniref:MFS family permease n=1 Tax=Alicyclobacillus cycloheptanicus TaxID=1457 RepID=A0ABT9XMB2_9BACL|nr:MFS transporter [Alicyclobacillus cycloheptanicus]MDQ0191455.1 MFS family permease [Alicyclobacillus cycloheptanicus]WDM00782.1 MFS transporter [Alicyclobacillus cycloheptanicus]
MIRLLMNNRRLRMFLLGSTLSTLGSAMSTVALPLYVLAHFHSSLLLGVVFVARELPGIVLALWAGGLVDRLGAWKSTIVALAVCGVGIGAIPMVGFSFVLTVVSSAVLGIGLTLLSPTVSIYIPALVSDEALESANGAFQSTFMEGNLVGTALGGWIVERGQYGLGFYADAMTYFLAIGTVLLVGPVRPNLVAVQASEQRIINSFRRMVVEILRNKAFTQMLVVDGGMYFAMGAINVALPLYTAHTLRLPWLYSPILMTTGVGELLAGLMSSSVPKLVHEGQEGKWYVGMASLVGMSYILMVLFPSVTTVFVASFIGSIITGLLYVIYASTMQRTIPAEAMGKFQTVMSGLSSAFTGGGSVVAGVLSSGLWGFGISACVLWICAVVSMVLVRA